MIKLLVDNRERAVIEHINFDNVEYVQLNVGDYQFWDEEKLLLIVERKTYADLAASIKDGRYKEQRYRLNEIRQDTNCMIIYFIEGKKHSGLPSETLQSAVLSIISKESTGVICTDNAKESMLALKCFLCLDYATFYEDESFENFCTQLHKKLMFKQNNTTYNDASVSANTKKKSFMTQRNVFVQQLCLVKSVSLKIAEKVSTQYETFASLIHAYDECSSEKQRETMLKDIMVDGKRVGPVASKNIYYYCYGIEKNDTKKERKPRSSLTTSCLV